MDKRTVFLPTEGVTAGAKKQPLTDGRTNYIWKMDRKGVFLLSIGMAFAGIFYWHITKPILDVCEIEKCPYCYGVNQCEHFKQNKITLKTDSFVTFIYNYISVKNVFLAKLGSVHVVLKKLGHNVELNNLDKLVCSEISYNNMCNFSVNNSSLNYTEKIVTFLNNASDLRSFKSCSEDTSALFLKGVLESSKGDANDSYIKNIWSILHINVEPLMLQVRYLKN